MTGQLFIGLMSGTSMDAVDTALVHIDDNEFDIIAYEQFSIDQDLRKAVRALDAKSNITQVSEYDSILGHLFADSVLKILQQQNISPEAVTAIGSHGQTILHLPDDQHPRTLQIGDPNIITQKTGITTVADFRRRDMAAGGQGAPLAPAFHNARFRSQDSDRLIVNLGGIANLTALPKDPKQPIYGFDTGPGNGLLDDWNRRHNNTDMDKDSAWATSGEIHKTLLQQFMADPYFKLAHPKSTGRDYFNIDWVDTILASLEGKIAPEDVQATLLELTTKTLAESILCEAPQTSEIYLCGGGAHNPRRVSKLKQLLPNMEIADTGNLGIDPDAVEAACFAWLARQTISGNAGNHPRVTGADNFVILGGIYPA